MHLITRGDWDLLRLRDSARAWVCVCVWMSIPRSFAWPNQKKADENIRRGVDEREEEDSIHNRREGAIGSNCLQRARRCAWMQYARRRSKGREGGRRAVAAATATATALPDVDGLKGSAAHARSRRFYLQQHLLSLSLSLSSSASCEMWGFCLYNNIQANAMVQPPLTLL